jgi:hypothetical protein
MPKWKTDDVRKRLHRRGVGWDAYQEHFWEHRLVRFEYAYVGLPAL